METSPRHTSLVIALGGNLGNPPQAFRRVIAHLQSLSSAPVAVGPLVRSPPSDGSNQPEYWNTVVCCAPWTDPVATLDTLLSWEADAGRAPRSAATRWGPRPLDLDIVLWGDLVVATPRLRIPHPEFARRGFVLHPLAALAPGLVDPVSRLSVATLSVDAAPVQNVPWPSVDS